MNTSSYLKGAVALAAFIELCVGTRAWALDTTSTPTPIAIQQYAFVPASVAIAAGATVEWLNRDDDPHTVKSDPERGELKSPALDTNDTYRFTFKTPGTYKYFCTLHPHMQGTIIVR